MASTRRALRAVVIGSLFFSALACRSSDKPDDAGEAKSVAASPEGKASADSAKGDAQKVDLAECAGAPPVVSCCSDDTSECRSCRQAALDSLVKWREKCATDDVPVCGKPPTPGVCCEAMIPSCEACKARNRRVTDEYRRRCEQH